MRIIPETAPAHANARLAGPDATREPGGAMLAALFLGALGAVAAAVLVWALGSGLLLAFATYAGSGALFTVSGAAVLAALTTAGPQGRKAVPCAALAPAQPA
jgi:hypothetical protein